MRVLLFVGCVNHSLSYAKDAGGKGIASFFVDPDTGAAEPGPYDHAWFTEKASKTDPSQAEHGIYAVSFRRTHLKFPLVWAPAIHYVYAEDVTRFSYRF